MTPPLVSDLNQGNWDLWTQQFSKNEVNLYMPKFKLTYEISLNDILKTLGMEVAFDPSQADFTKLHKTEGVDRVYIRGVKHKTFVEVNEEGTEAAAATSEEARVTSVPPPPKLMKINRPFLFLIRENRSGTILFVGKIMDPA